MLESIVGALLPVIVTLLLGVLAGWRGDEDKKAAQALNTMVLVYALPLLLFAGTVTTSREQLAAELPLAGALFAGLLIPFVIAYGVTRFVLRRDASAAALEALSFGFPAIAFTGVPVLTPLIGERTTAVIAWAGIINNVVVLPIVLIMLTLAQKGSGEPGPGRREVDENAYPGGVGRVIRQAMAHALTQPVVIAPCLAISFVLVGFEIPAVLLSAFKLLGSTVGGVSLFASGVILQSQTITLSWPALISALGRVLVVPIVAYFALTGFGAEPELRRIVVLALALAAAPMQVILSVRYRAHEKENAALLLYSNVLCIPTLSLFIWLTG